MRRSASGGVCGRLAVSCHCTTVLYEDAFLAAELHSRPAPEERRKPRGARAEAMQSLAEIRQFSRLIDCTTSHLLKFPHSIQDNLNRLHTCADVCLLCGLFLAVLSLLNLC